MPPQFLARLDSPSTIFDGREYNVPPCDIAASTELNTFFSIDSARGNTRISFSMRLSLTRQPGVIDSVKEFLRVQAHLPSVCLGDVLWRCCYHLRSQSSGSEPIAVFAKS